MVLAAIRRLQSDQLVKLRLDDVDATYNVPKAILCDASPYFVSALEGRYQEASTQTLPIPGTDHDTLMLFLYWACGKKIPQELTQEPSDPELRLREGGDLIRYGSANQQRMIRLWCFSDACFMSKAPEPSYVDVFDQS